VQIPKAAAVPVLQVEIPTMTTSSPSPSVGEEGLQDDLDMTVGADASSLNPKVARILSEVVAATWEEHQLQEILSTVARVPGYSEKPITEKIESCILNNRDSCLNTK
jgi:hypothetical protein